MIMPAVKDLETGQTHVFRTAIGERYLVAKSGTPDIVVITRWCSLFFHSLSIFQPVY